MSSPPPRVFPWLLTVLTAVTLTALVALGVWQLRRLDWKQDLIARAEAAGGRPPAPLAAVLAEPDPEFRRALVLCPGIDRAAYVELRTLHEGEPGVRLISACRPPGLDRTLLIDRGFVAAAVSARPPVEQASMPVGLRVVVRDTPPPGAMTPPPEGRMFFGRDNAAMAHALGVAGPVDPHSFFAETSSNPEWRALGPFAPPPAFSNNHLGYAITWFGLALALAGVYAALMRKKLAA